MALNDKVEKALRTLSKTSEGPFRVIAYGCTPNQGNQIRLSKDLRELARRTASDPEPAVLIEEADPFSSATGRPAFRRQILPFIRAGLEEKRGGGDPSAALVGRGAPARARERLADIAATLPRILGDVDRTLAGWARPSSPAAPEEDTASLSEGGPSGNAVPSAPPTDPSPSTGPDPADRIPLVLFRSFEDLGADAEAVAQAIWILVEGGAHVVVHDDHLDTRTREGRLVARNTLRLGAIKAERARERALADLARRREGFRVYGPIPFGFRREGQELLPLKDQIAAVKRARELAGLGQTPVTIAATLNHEARSWKDGSRWTWRRVAQILKNPIYERALVEAKA